MNGTSQQIIEILSLAKKAREILLNKSMKFATAESCTGGLVSSIITELAGASEVFECGFVCYSNHSKTTMLSVPEDLIIAEGAVSKKVAEAMAIGALNNAKSADIAISVTGIAGPGGGSELKPVGLVHFAALKRDGKNGGEREGEMIYRKMFYDPTLARGEIRQKAAYECFSLLLEILGE